MSCILQGRCSAHCKRLNEVGRGLQTSDSGSFDVDPTEDGALKMVSGMAIDSRHGDLLFDVRRRLQRRLELSNLKNQQYKREFRVNVVGHFYL